MCTCKMSLSFTSQMVYFTVHKLNLNKSNTIGGKKDESGDTPENRDCSFN